MALSGATVGDVQYLGKVRNFFQQFMKKLNQITPSSVPSTATDAD